MTIASACVIRSAIASRYTMVANPSTTKAESRMSLFPNDIVPAHDNTINNTNTTSTIINMTTLTFSAIPPLLQIP